MDLPEGWKTFNTPAAFGASEPKGKGQLIIGLMPETVNPDEAANATIAAIEQQRRKKPADARRVDVHGNPAFYAVYAEKKSSLHLLWLTMGGKTFRIAGVSDDQRREALRAAALSLRPLSPEDKARVRVLRLRILAARSGESLEAFCKRTDSFFKPELIAVLNDLGSKPLAQGQLLKVGRLEPYKPKQ